MFVGEGSLLKCPKCERYMVKTKLGFYCMFCDYQKITNPLMLSISWNLVTLKQMQELLGEYQGHVDGDKKTLDLVIGHCRGL